MLNIRQRDLERAFDGHCKAGPKAGAASGDLLLFYAVECGIKALLLRREKLSSTKELSGNNSISHDLKKGLNLLRAPISLPGRVMPKDRTRKPIPGSKLHEAWRYGFKLDEAEATDYRRLLQEAAEWLKGEIDS